MAMAESQEHTVLKDDFYNDPSQLSQLLRQRAGGELAFHFTDSTTRNLSGNVQSLSTAEGPSPRPARQRATGAARHSLGEARHRRVRVGSRHATPSLPKHNTAPASTVPETEVTVAPRMYETFDGAMDEPGDTQPDSQMFRLYTSGLVESKRNSNIEPQPNLAVTDVTSADPPTDSFEMIDSSSSQPSNTITSPTALHHDSDIQFHDNVPATSPLKFETPALVGRTRDGLGHDLSSAIKTDTTPGTVLSASAFFGFGTGMNGNAMSLTQAFNATQARTSPIAEPPAEDTVFERPSPNFPNGRERGSSPSAPLSSPLKNSVRPQSAGGFITRCSSEPRVEYETLRQSQDRRKLELRHEDTWDSPISQDSWEDPTVVQQRFERLREKDKLDQEAALVFANVSAPTPSVRRTKDRSLHSTGASLPSSKARKPETLVAFDGPAEANHQEHSQDEVLQGSPACPPDDLSQPTPIDARSSRNAPPGKETNGEYVVQVPHTSSHPRHPHTHSGQSAHILSQPDTPSSQLQRESRSRTVQQTLDRSLATLKSSKESEVIMDSQPGEDVDTPRPPKALRFPSSPSINQYSINQTVMQSQSGLTSLAVSSSMPPRPPKSSSQEQGKLCEVETSKGNQEIVPSSPPVLSQNPNQGELTYDEHAYDEHSENDEGANDMEVAIEDADVYEGLPTIRTNGLEAEADLKDGNQMTTLESRTGEDRVHSGEEIPETVEQELPELHDEDEELIRSSHPEDDVDGNSGEAMAPPRQQRQSTIPETDNADDFRTSAFLDDHQLGIDAHIETGGLESGPPVSPDSNGTEAFHTGKEHQSASQLVTDATEGAIRPSSGAVNVRSLLDIANQPDTQGSTDGHTIDMPQLSFASDQDDMLDTIMETSPARPTKRRKVTYSVKTLKSPTKTTDPLSDRASPSPVQRADQGGWSPPFAPTQQHEEQGSLVATRARNIVANRSPAQSKVKPKSSSKSRPASKPKQNYKQPKTPQKGSLKAVNKALLSRSPIVTDSSLTVTNGAKGASTADSTDVDVKMDEMGSDCEVDELAGPPPPTPKKKVIMEPACDDGEAPAGELLNPNRVFAAWPQGHYWPATCLRKCDAMHYQVRYDFDGTIHKVVSSNIRALDLCCGDQVKLEIKGMKRNAYIIVGFKNKIDPDNLDKEYPLTDRRGYTTLVVEEKDRNSLVASKDRQSQKRIEVQLSTIYLTKALWGRLSEHTYQQTPANVSAKSTPRGLTPSGPDSTPAPADGKRRTSRKSLLRDVATRAESEATTASSNGTIFENMMFAVSLTSENVKGNIKRLITSHSGAVAEDGFEDIFFAGDGSSQGSPDGLTLKGAYENLSFVALIADSHSRKIKHCQALALNIPILHHRWLHDCVAAARPIPFEKYLLPAGISTFLDPAGVVRSRIIDIYDPANENLSFQATVDQRRLLLQDARVVIIAKTKKEREEKAPYFFLTHALGPAQVSERSDIAAAAKELARGRWSIVYVHGAALGVAEAAAELFNDREALATANKLKNEKRKSTSASRKRKRDESVEADAGPDVLVRAGKVGGREVRIICDEYIIQSLILGALIDE